MKSSGRSIRRHVLSCYRRQFPAECKGVSDAQIHDLLVSQEEKGAIHTGLKRWRLRRRRRLAMDLPPHERWDCPNQCGRYFRSTSSRSIAKHKLSCRYSERTGSDELQVQSSDSTPNLHSLFASIMSPSTTSSSSSSSSSSFSSFSSLSSSSSSHLHGGSSAPYYGASSDVADSPISTSQSTQRTPLLSSVIPSESQPIERLNHTLRLSEPTPSAAAATTTGTVVRPIPRLHASLPLVQPAASATSSSSFSPRLTTLTADKQLQPPRIKPLLLQTCGDAMSSLLAHPSPSAFRPLYTNTAASYSSQPLPPTIFNLSPLHALASVRHGYVLCSFPAQQVQVPVIGWPY